MKYFGRSKKEHLEDYNDELENIERKVLVTNSKEMVRLLERVENATPYHPLDRNYRNCITDPGSIMMVKREIHILLDKLNTDFKAALFKYFQEKS